MKLLFDIYHVQVMHGDLIRRIEQTKNLIGHVHTAGVPGRGELDNTQEINYSAVIKKLVDVDLVMTCMASMIKSVSPALTVAPLVTKRGEDGSDCR